MKVFRRTGVAQLGLSAFLWIGLGIGVAEALAAEPCETLATASDVLQCALKNHPDLQRAEASVNQTSALRDAAAQFPNPEIDSKTTFGSTLGDQIFRTEVNLAQPLELGGKRGSRIERATAEGEVISASALRRKEEVTLAILQALYRLRQAQAEIAAFEEALDTFHKIERQFRSRPRLNPEQEVSLGVFQLAEGDYRLRKTSLEVEVETLKRTLEVAIGQPFPASTIVLPAKKTKWPKLEASTETTQLKGSVVKSAQAELSLAQAEYSVQKSLTWPDLRIGPTFTKETEGAISFNTYGFNVSFPLPLWSQNGGGRAFAVQGVSRAEQSYRLLTTQVNKERQILLNRYQRSVGAIQSSVSVAEIERKHQNAEVLFRRGLISSSLVIEAHRQIVDFTRSQHEQELEALQALWKLYVIDGRLSEVQP